MQQKLIQGSALIFAMVISVIIVGFAGTAITLAHYNSKYNAQQGYQIQARYVAEAGLSRAVKYMNSNFMNNELSYTIVDSLANTKLWDGVPQELAVNRDGKTVKIGEYLVEIKVLTPGEIVVPTTEDIVGNASNSCRYINAIATGYVPDTINPKARLTIIATYKMQTEVAHLFDYSYFINNWGFLSGRDVTSQGNVRANGSFTLEDSPTILSKPRFESSNGSDLIGYIDDNGDGMENNQDGGIYAWDTIIGLPNKLNAADLYAGLQGENSTVSVPQMPMPNLTNFTFYEKKALADNSYIKYYKNGVQYTINSIYGSSTERKNLYLEGTYDHPIEIKGTMVVHGNLIVRGWVTGQGGIYCADNIYIPQRILYKNAPGNLTPSTNTEAARENWRATYSTTDMLGFFARENIVFSDFTSTAWQSAVDTARQTPLNESKEDSGLDKIPATGDSGENDGIFSIEKDTNGNPIPGTGEDIDGDGVYDPTTPMTAFNLRDTNFFPNVFATDIGDWGGNIPAGVTKYSDITYWNETTDNPGVYNPFTTNISQNFPQIDGFYYTNHFVAGVFANKDYNYKNGNPPLNHLSNGRMFQVFGSLIARNTALTYNCFNGILLAHDDRLTAESGEKYGFILPRVWKPLTLIATTMQ